MTRTIQATGQGLHFDGCDTGVDTTKHGNCMFNLIDSTAVNTHIVVRSGVSTNACHSLVLENVVVDGSVHAVRLCPFPRFFGCPASETFPNFSEQTVVVAGEVVARGSIIRGFTWIRGNIYAIDSKDPEWSNGKLVETTRPEALVNDAGHFHTVVPPTYEEFRVLRLLEIYRYRKDNQVINVKNVAEHPVAGDGYTDDTASLQAILNDLADNHVAFFPYGIYLLTDTLFIPPQSRLYGEAWPQLMAHGAKFNDAQNPRVMVRVGEPGQVGVAQMTDFLFTVSDVLPGTVMVEVNMAGEKPGDVGFFNCHFRVGGARGSVVRDCARPEHCNAAHLSAHFTPSSSVYWENSWSWSANHDLDGAKGMETFYGQPSDAGGFLIESQHGTWMLGIGSGKSGCAVWRGYSTLTLFLLR
jgi:glucan 1,3-beta-glucosidase